MNSIAYHFDEIKSKKLLNGSFIIEGFFGSDETGIKTFISATFALEASLESTFNDKISKICELFRNINFTHNSKYMVNFVYESDKSLVAINVTLIS